MQTNKFGEMIFSESDVCNLLMQGKDLDSLRGMIVDHTVDLDQLLAVLPNAPRLYPDHSHDCTVQDFHKQQQRRWHMPAEYQDLDIASHVLSLCKTEDELQRAGQELLMFQERNLFDLLRFLKYLVDVMTENHVIWGVGRGSSVSSYVLYLLGVHRVNSMFYDLDPREFLR